MTPEQKAARTVGMSHGVPEEFAIDCKARACVDITIGSTSYPAGSMGVQLYDSRKRDKLRRARSIVVLSDAWLPQPGPATLPPVTVETQESQNGGKDSSSTPAPADASVPKQTGNGPGQTGTQSRRSQRTPPRR